MYNILNSKDGKRKKPSSHIKRMQKQNEINEKLVKSSGMNLEKDIPDSYQLISIQVYQYFSNATESVFKMFIYNLCKYLFAVVRSNAHSSQ